MLKDQTEASYNTLSTNAPIQMNLLMNITTFLHCVTCVLGVVGNGVVIYVTGLRLKKTVNTIWFLNLAVYDFLFTFFLLLNIIYKSCHFDWPLGDFLCKLGSLVIVSLAYLNSYLNPFLYVFMCEETETEAIFSDSV